MKLIRLLGNSLAVAAIASVVTASCVGQNDPPSRASSLEQIAAETPAPTTAPVTTAAKLTLETTAAKISSPTTAPEPTATKMPVPVPTPKPDTTDTQRALEGGPILETGDGAVAVAEAVFEGVPASGQFASLSAGFAHSCGLWLDGSAECWGANQHGESSPPDGRFASVSAGDQLTCGLRPDGSVECWGLGASRLWAPPGGRFASLSVGAAHACGSRPDGSVECWGLDAFGESSPPDGRFASVFAGYYYMCGLRFDGSVECWGKDESGQSSPPDGRFASVSAGYYHACGMRRDGAVECWGTDDQGQSSPLDGRFGSVSAGGFHTCGLRRDGAVECWGSDEHAQSSPTDERFGSVTAGGHHTCGLRRDATPVCWGADEYGQSSPFVETAALSTDESSENDPAPGRYASLSAGYAHTCGLKPDGAVECWGIDESSETAPRHGWRFTSISAGYAFTCGLRPNGAAECWGSDSQGQSSPPDGPFASLSVGVAHACGLRPNGSAECWGSDVFGASSPPAGSFAMISAGHYYTCGLRPDGTAECWGWDESGKSSPPNGRFTFISAGYHHACGLRPDGAVECWGSDEFGQSSTPDGRFVAASAGVEHTCGLRHEGTIECWGSHGSDESPPQDRRFSFVSAGYGYTCGLPLDGPVECWGPYTVTVGGPSLLIEAAVAVPAETADQDITGSTSARTEPGEVVVVPIVATAVSTNGPMSAPTPTVTPTAVAVQETVEGGVACSEFTGYCRALEYRDPISLLIPCNGKTVYLEETRASGTELVGMCAPNINEMPNVEIERLLETGYSGDDPAPLGSTLVRGDIAGRVKSVTRFDGGSGEGCESVSRRSDCLRVEMEITNVRADGEGFVFEDDRLRGRRFGTYADVETSESRGTSFESVENLRGIAHLLPGERMTATLFGSIYKEWDQVMLQYRGDETMLFAIGSVVEWPTVGTVQSEGAELPRKERLEHVVECGFEYMKVEKDTITHASRSSTRSLGTVAAHCDPDVATISEEELATMRGAPNTDPGGRSNPVPLGQTHKSDELAIRVLTVARHDSDEVCAVYGAPEGYVCVAVEFEIANLGSEAGFKRHGPDDFGLAGNRGIAYWTGPDHRAYTSYGGPRASTLLRASERLTTRIVRYVHPDEGDLMMVYEDYPDELRAFWLTDTPEAVPDIEAQPARPPFSRGEPGTSVSNPAPVGSALQVHKFLLRVLEFERGWSPDVDLQVPEVLVKFSGGDLIEGLAAADATEWLSREDPEGEEHKGASEYVRVRFEALQTAALNESWSFDAGHMFLVDDERRVFLSSFYTQEEVLLRYYSSRVGFNDVFYRFRHHSRRAGVYGGGRVKEELAWLVPSDASGLTLVYAPYHNEAGGFLALEGAGTGGEYSVPPYPSWVVGALPSGATSASNPAPKGAAAAYGEVATIRISEVARSTDRCGRYSGQNEDMECLRVEFDLAVKPRRDQHWLLGSHSGKLFTDVKAITEDRMNRAPFAIPWHLEFASFFDWAELNFRGWATASFSELVPKGWRDGIFVFQPRRDIPAVYLSLTGTDN